MASELASEDTDTKVKRYRQLDEQQCKAERDSAIQRFVFREFEAPPDSRATSNANVLGRSHRLSSLNPLLD